MFGKEYVMGTCYYPEHWDKNLWESDLDRMLESGITVIRIAEFAWNKIEPTEGEFDYSFFDEFLSLCEAKGMRVIMGTPTATPPAWLTTKYPEVLNADENGVLYKHGGRRHYNYNSETYRNLCKRIVTCMVEHYGKNKAVVGWQIDNEFNCETSEFHSEADSKAFRVFLKNKYETLDVLNDAWGTVFWNQTYTDWNEIFVPGKVPACHNPHQMLDYYRFISDSTLSFCKMQADILRQYIKPGDFVTTNGLFWNMDNHKMARECLDIYMYDSYPSFAFGLEKADWVPKGLKDRHWSRNLTETRSVCPHFGIMEQQSGANGSVGGMEGPAPRPGQLTLWAMQSVAHGADYISFFRWRTATIGSEIYWHGILDYDNRDNRKLAEVRDFYTKLKKIDEVCGADFDTSFGYLKDYDNEWETATDVWHRKVNDASSSSVFTFSQKNHMPFDYIYMEEDLTAEDLKKYPVLLYPHPVITNEKRVKILTDYVSQGGTLVLGCRSGYKDMNGHCVMTPQPGLFSQLTGSDVKDFTFVHEVDEGMSADFNGQRIDMPLFNDILSAQKDDSDVKILATYNDGYYSGMPALLENSFGKGRVFHLGSVFTESNLKALFKYIGVRSIVNDIADVPEEVEVVVRSVGEQKYLFLLNYSFDAQSVVLTQESTDMFTGKDTYGFIKLSPFDVKVYKLK